MVTEMTPQQLEQIKSYLVKQGYKEANMPKGFYYTEDGSDRAADLRKDPPIVGIIISGNIVTTGHGNLKVVDDQQAIEHILKSKSPSAEYSEKQPPQNSPVASEKDKSKLGAGDTSAKKGKPSAICKECGAKTEGTIDELQAIYEQYDGIYCPKCQGNTQKPKPKIITCIKCGFQLNPLRAEECSKRNVENICEDCEEKTKGEVKQMEEKKEEISLVAKEPATETALSVEIIKQYICPTATDAEAYNFLQLCVHRGLNPFLREAYLIKYGNQPASMVVGKDAFTRKAEESKKLDGYEAGIIVIKEDKTIERRIGVVQFEGEKLVGGWAKVYRNDMKYPFVCEVPLNEYIKRKPDGTPQASWAIMPGTMIRKVALVQSLREAFTRELGGCYDAAELGAEVK